MISSNPPAALRREVRLAAVLGMSQETRDAWALLGRRLSNGPLTLLGAPGPNRVLLDRARRAGALEGALEDRAAPTSGVVIPFSGAAPAQRTRWLECGHEVLDLTLPAIRRARTMLGLLRAEGLRLVLAGHRGDPECEAIAAGIPGVAVVEDADEANALPFAPASGLICQTLLSSHRFQAIAHALRGRHRDGRLQVFDTQSPAQKQREKALIGLAGWADFVLIAADPGDASGRALYECARWHGRPARLVADTADLTARDLAGFRRVVITAGEFTPPDLVVALENQVRKG